MRFAYADPPYPGQARRHYGAHPDYGGEVDHAALIERLELCPPLSAKFRLCIWHRASRTFKPARAQWSFEPVLVKTPRWRGSDYVPDLAFACDPRGFLGGEITGQKPPAFCRWVFRLLGAQDGDTLADLFPGSGAVTREWEAWTSQTSLDPHFEQEPLSARP